MNIAKRALLLLTIAASGGLAAAQEFQPVQPYGLGPSLVASGSQTVWAYVPGPSYSIYEWNSAAQTFQYKFTFSSLKSMSVGGGSAVQNDEKWLLDGFGYLWRYDTPTQTLQLIQADNRMQSVTVGPGYSDSCHPYEVWVAFYDSTTQGRFAERYNFCNKVFGGVGTASTPAGPSKIATGGGEVWALNTSNQVFRYSASTNAFVQMPGSLTQLAVGVNGVWGLDSAGNFYEFNPVNQAFDEIVQNYTSPLESVFAGGNGVWVSTTSGYEVFHYVAGDRGFYRVTGAEHYANDLAVGTGAGIWNINLAGNIIAFITP